MLCREIIGNAEHHIRIIELLLQSNRWGEKLPDSIIVPGLCALLIFGLISLCRILLRLVVPALETW